MTVEKLLTDHIDIWSSALQTRSTAGRGSNGKIDLYGIKKLRELILELAVRGKLVPQDPNDEPASELLKRIAAEKAELVKQGKIKKQKPLPEIREDEKPFELPVGWEWWYFDEIINQQYPISYGVLVPGEPEVGGVPFVRIGDIAISNPPVLPEKTISKLVDVKYERTRLNGGEILMAVVGSIGKLGIAPESWKGANIARALCRIVPVSNLSKEFILLILQSKFMQSSFKGDTRTLAQPTLNVGLIKTSITPIPPFTEQHRIVAKVNELMSLCDQLEQRSLTSLDAHQQLVETLLTTLTDSQNAEELAENWARISQHFDTLFTTEASIDALKQTILQLAVMGKLVPQDPNDEPASELLKRIEQEKAQLVKEGKIKKQKPLPSMSDEVKPFDLPQGWEWCRFEDIVDIQSGITKGRNLVGRELISVPYLRVANVQRGYLDLSEIKIIEIPVDEKDKYHVKSNDLLITEGGDWDTVGRTAIWTDSSFYVANQNHVFKARPIVNELNVKWIETFMNSSVSRNYFAGASKQTTNLASINKTQLRGCLIALPSVSETSRILEQYISLLNVCDILKSRLQSAQQTQLHLADALTDAALN
ncbi:restriction endonuclease subunit S [Serratia fonticola]|uniref:restriction endonuclease subunit S n=1 Tax=Serratia fonticola TaxID=47917 RepID=UPI00217845B4|nr:restriction endonuclease subunit S [Serratia fonticola]CAI0855925.1 Type I restriction enzyme EcoKI specificity protein [Serratia fonticola]CAI0933036.1 Type I restriction enzyme EcoKI specificity protein [Serratia fonticola]